MSIPIHVAFHLSEGERRSPVWIKVLDHLNEQLSAARAKLEGDADEKTTQRLRGSIGTLKALIDLERGADVLQ